MSELIYFLRFLKTRWYILLSMPLVAMAISYFLTKQLPNTYRSEGRLATGIVDKTDQLFVSEETEQESEINRKFDNLIQLMRMKKVMDQVSYRLLLHDLSVKADSAFKKPSKIIQELNQSEKKKIVNEIRAKNKTQQELYPDSKLERKITDLIESNGYGSTSLLDKLVIKRLGNSDYISMVFEGSNPAYTAFVVNSLSEEFLRIYSSRLMESNNRSLEFFEKLMLQKLASLNERMQELKTYKIQNRVLNLNEQARSLYGHIIDFETRREIAKKDVTATRAALRNINQRFEPSEQRYVESALSEINQKIALTRERLQSINDTYIRNNFDPRLKVKVDSLQEAMNRQIQLSTDKNFANPQAAKNDLVNHKLELEIALELAENSISTIEAEINRLNRKYDGMVPNEASIQQFETSIEIASKEYIEALQRFNNARLDSYSPITLRLVERATRGELLPSKKLLLVIVSGLAGFVFCFIFFTAMHFLDNAVRTPGQLANITGLPVLGRLNRINGGKSIMDLHTKTDKSSQLYADLIHSIRFEIDEEIRSPKIISITSLHENVGKTDFVFSLAWAYGRINRRVLIVDGNFGLPDISKQTKSNFYLEDYLKGKISSLPDDQVVVLANAGGVRSILELVSELTIQEKLAELKQNFDVILLDTPSLNDLYKAREWISYSDRTVAVYMSGKVIRDADIANLTYLRSRGAEFSGWVLSRTDNEIELIGKTLTKP